MASSGWFFRIPLRAAAVCSFSAEGCGGSADEFQQLSVRGFGKERAEVVADADERLRGRAVGDQLSVERLGCRVAGHAPAVGVAVAVEVVFEVGDDEPHLHLQARQHRVERDLFILRDLVGELPGRAPSAPPGEAEHAAQLLDGGRPLDLDGLHDHVVERRRILVRRQRPRAPVVGPVREPRAADKARLAVEELAVGAVSLADDGPFPLPGPLLVGEPVFRGDHLLDREAGDAAPEEGQEAQLQTAALHIGRTFQIMFHGSLYHGLSVGPLRFACETAVRT